MIIKRLVATCTLGLTLLVAGCQSIPASLKFAEVVPVERWNLDVIKDTSGSPTAAINADVTLGRCKTWIESAGTGSRLTVYGLSGRGSTSPVVRLWGVEVPEFHAPVKSHRRQWQEQATADARKALTKHETAVDWSPILESTWWCMRMNRSAQVPYEILIWSDLLQTSDTVDFDVDTLHEKSDKVIVRRVLSLLPAMANPPRMVSVLELAGTSGETDHLSGTRQLRIEGLVRQVLGQWRVKQVDFQRVN